MFTEGRYLDRDGGEFTYAPSANGMIIGTFTSTSSGKTFTIFNQSACGWPENCNRAAQASVCSGYWSGNPLEMVTELKKATENAAPFWKPTYDKVGAKCESRLISSTTLSTEVIKESILSGQQIILWLRGNGSVGPGRKCTSKYGKYWASEYHWVAILGYRMENGAEEIFVSDSAHTDYSRQSGWWPIDEFDELKDATACTAFVSEI